MHQYYCDSLIAYGHIRLANKDSGVLEIYLNQWGYVCDDGWDRIASEVVCKQLGQDRLISFETGVEVNNLLYPFLIDDVECNGNESTIFECTHTLKHNCASGEHVSITCGSVETMTTPTTPTTSTPTTPTTSTPTTPTTSTPTTSTTTTTTTAPTTSTTTTTTTTPTTSTTTTIPTTSTTPTLGAEDIIEQLDDIMNELDEAETISDDKSGQTADMAKVVIDASNDNVDIEGEEKNKILENAATTAQTIVNKTNGTFSDETTEKITDLLSSIVNGSSDIQASTESQVFCS